MSRKASACYTQPVKQLIINADDFGLTPGVNRAIIEMHEASLLTSATLMASSAAFDEAASAAKLHPGLGVGCHVVLVDGAPVLPPDQVPTLIERSRGEFRPTLGAFARDLQLGRIREAEIEAEAQAQIHRLQLQGIAVTHVDTHKHTHMFPGVLRPLVRAALGRKVTAIRNPFEPSWSLAATPNAPLVRRLEVRLLRIFQKYFLDCVRQAGLATTDGAIGVLSTGTLDSRTIHSLLRAIPEGVWELVCHPGYQDENLLRIRTRLQKSRDIERMALLEAVTAHSEIERIHFGHLSKRRVDKE
jgi:chitin disaccharide deacetylase